MEVNPQNFKKYLEIVTEIDDCLFNISKDTGMLSSNDFDNHPDYQKLISMVIELLHIYSTMLPKNMDSHG